MCDCVWYQEDDAQYSGITTEYQDDRVRESTDSLRARQAILLPLFAIASCKTVDSICDGSIETDFNLQELLDAIRQKQEFTFDEYKIILDLQCGVDPTQGEKAASQATDRNYNMYVIELHGLELENSADV